MKYEIHTPSYYGIIHDNGDIQREDVEHSPSHQWKAVAVVRYNNFWHEVERIAFEDWPKQLPTLSQWTYKNGKPQYRLIDYDHGTYRSCALNYILPL